MARRGGRRGRRSRSRQNRSRRSTRSTRSRRTTTRRSTPSRRRNTRTTTRASNRRANVSRARRAAPKKAAPKARRAPTRNKRGSGISTKRKNIGTKIGTSVKNTAKKVTSGVKSTAKKVAKTVGRITRPPSARAKTVKNTRQSAFNNQVKKIQAANKPTTSFGPVADGAKYARNITNYNMKYGKTPEIRAKAYEQSLNKKSFKGLSDGQTFGVGPVASGDAYARGLNTDNQNVENRLRQVRNLGSTLTGGLIPSVRKLTDKEIADRRIKNAEFRKNNLMRRRGGGGGKALAVQTDPIRTPPPEEIIEETQPITGDMSGTDSSNLTRIQNQAYATTLANNMAGLTGDFDFGPQSSQMSISEAPGLQAGQSRGRRQIRRFGRGRRRGAGDSFRRGGRRIQQFTSTQLNI